MHAPSSWMDRSRALRPKRRKVRQIVAASIALALSCVPLLATAASPSVPVRVGGDVALAACSDRAQLVAERSGDDAVDILSGPTGSFRAIDRLAVGTIVLRCDENGTHVGVIYGEGDCGVSEPMPRRGSYRGQCASGWVHNRSLEPVESPAA